MYPKEADLVRLAKPCSHFNSHHVQDHRFLRFSSLITHILPFRCSIRKFYRSNFKLWRDKLAQCFTCSQWEPFSRRVLMFREQWKPQDQTSKTFIGVSKCKTINSMLHTSTNRIRFRNVLSGWRSGSHIRAGRKLSTDGHRSFGASNFFCSNWSLRAFQ